MESHHHSAEIMTNTNNTKNLSIQNLVKKIYPVFFQITNNHDIAERIATKYILQSQKFLTQRKKEIQPFENMLHRIENSYQNYSKLMYN